MITYKEFIAETRVNMRCNKCHRPMKGTTAYDGACECGGLIEKVPEEDRTPFQVAQGEHDKPKTTIHESDEVHNWSQAMGVAHHSDWRAYTDQLDRERKHIEPLHQSLKQHYKYTNNESRLINDYSHISNRINNHLWSSHIGKKEPKTTVDWGQTGTGGHFTAKPEDRLSVKNMDHLVSKHKTPKNLVVFSGLHTSPEHQMKEHGHFIHPGYMSTSINPRQARNFARVDKFSKHDPTPESALGYHHGEVANETEHGYGHVMRLIVPKGHPGIYTGDHSAHEEEKEFILPRGMKINIHKKPEIDHKNRAIIWDGHIEH